MPDFEKLGVFYLGRRRGPNAGGVGGDSILYDSRDLTTHAVVVGMTGSGKTGLGLALLEEAALDGIPALAIDPKGDLGNLLLTFPDLRPSDFRPWIDEGEAARQGLDPAAHAERVAAAWRAGLESWGEDGARIARLKAAADFAIYTPGSSAGLPLAVLGSFAPPPAAMAADPDAARERVGSAVAGLLALIGQEADPVRSRETIFLATLFHHAWQSGIRLDLPAIIRGIQRPPFDRVGVMDLESFYPAKERFELSLALNNLLASPGFAAWMEGEPLDVGRLLWTGSGKPRISILSIAHLSDPERMFFVTMLLNEVRSWMRGQSGTSSLRALLYMDEVFGYFPPTANPPAKAPMLTLLKQARAFGLGVILSTQNPVDLDYKGLSNAGTWFLGRLQTERDKARVLEGLEGASAAAGAGFDRAGMEATLASLKSRVFLMNNVHEDEPVVFESRWCLSYLRGPLTRDQIRALTPPRPGGDPAAAGPVATPADEAPARPTPSGTGPTPGSRPVLPPDIPEIFLGAPATAPDPPALYRPFLLGAARIHFVDARADLDHWVEIRLLTPFPAAAGEDVWSAAGPAPEGIGSTDSGPAPGAGFVPLPAAAGQAKSYPGWKKSLADHLYRSRSLTLHTCPELKQTSRPGESEGEFRIRVAQSRREKRDSEVEALRARYAPKFAALQERIRRAERTAEVEKSQYDQQKLQTAISVGATLLGAFFGRKLAGAGTIGRATTAARGVGRAEREREDLARAAENTERLRQDLADLEVELRDRVSEIQAGGDPSALTLVPLEIRPRKSDTTVTQVALAWTPG